MACNLHRLEDPSQYLTHDWGLLPPPHDEIRVAERINLWWSLFLLDRITAVGTATPGVIQPGHYQASLSLIPLCRRIMLN